jgi:hypothetical protein
MFNPMQMVQMFPQFMESVKGKTPTDMLQDYVRQTGMSQEQLNKVQAQAQSMAQQMQGQFNQFKGMFGF